MKIQIPKFTAEHYFGFALALYWGKDIIFSYLRAVVLNIPYIKYAADYIFPSLLIVCLLLSFRYFIESISWKDIVFLGAVAVVFLSNIVLYPQNTELKNIAGSFFLSVFPLYFVGLRLEPSKHFRILYIMSIVNVWAFSAYYIVFSESSFDVSSMADASFMGRAYVLLPQLLIVFVGILNKKNVLNIITGVIGFVLLLMCGNRGSVLLLLLFLIIYLLFNTKKEKRILISILALSLVGILINYYEKMLVMVMTTFDRFGFSNRIFQRLSDGTFLKSNGRVLIIDKLTSAIWDKPIIGYGLCSDRTIAGTYAHNYAFELWTTFGILFGTAILVITIVIIAHAWKKSLDGFHRCFLLALMCCGIFKLFLSSSFLIEALFFMLMGYCVTQFRSNKQTRWIQE